MTASHSNRWLLLVTVAAGLLLITRDNFKVELQKKGL